MQLFKQIFLFIFIGNSLQLAAQNVGIGTTTPLQKLDVKGKLNIGNDNQQPQAGTIRFNEATKDFEGFNGMEWKSLTSSYSSGPYISSPGSFEEKGTDIAIHGEFAAISSPRYNGYDGRVTIFRRINNSWQAVQEIMGPAQTNAGFGKAVAMNDQYLVVGSPYHSIGFYWGRVSLYKKVNNQFQFLANYQSNAPATREFFGGTLCLYGGYLLIGPAKDETNITGKVYLYSIQNDGLQWEQSFDNPDGVTNQRFGESMAIDSTHLVIGASNADAMGFISRGKVYVYRYAGANTYTFTNELNYNNNIANNGDNFGTCLSLFDSTLVIGCPGFDINPLIDIGAIFTCKKNSQGFVSPQLVISTGPNDLVNGNFGRSAAIHKNILITGGSREVHQFIYTNGSFRYHRNLTNSFGGVEYIDAYKLALFDQQYGVGEPFFNGRNGRFILGDCRY